MTARVEGLEPAPGSRSARGEATRERLLVTAERLFAEEGIAAVSLRSIASAAGQGNNAAVHYHFGGRDDLLREIVGYRVAQGQPVRAQLITELLARAAKVGPLDLVRVVVHSLATYLEEGNHFLAFMSRYAVERGGFAGLEATPAQDSLHDLQAVLRPMLPGVSPQELEERWMIMMTSAIHTLARYQAAQHGDSLPAALPTLLEQLVGFLAHGIDADPTATSRPVDREDRAARGPVTRA